MFWLKNVDLIEFSVFLPPQIYFCIFAATFCLPFQILILFEINTDTLGASELIPAGAPCRLSTLPHGRRPELFYILHHRNSEI